jgi:hypothetical protein
MVIGYCVVASRLLIPAFASLEYPCRTIIHLAKDRPLNDMPNYRGMPMSMRWSRAVRRIFHEKADNAFSRSIE